MFSPSLLLTYSSLFLPTLSSPTPNKNGLVVQTTSGEIHGFINQTTPQVRQFLGVPYAEPPIGNLRFAAPETKSKGSPIKATTFPPSCMQLDSNSSSIYTNAVPQFLINGVKSLPVFVYIPGGGFISGGQDSLYKIPDQWVQKTQSHIVVVMNYRVNVFGFPNAKAITEDRNPGLLDQRKAVEWVHENIASFNGDPDRMTLWGQSAGGASVDSYGYAYPDEPIVKGLIIDSGSAYLLGNLAPEAEIGCMRNVSANAIENALSAYTSSGATPKLAFTPFPDNVTAFSNPADRAERGLVAKLPIIIGSNSNEGAGFVTFSEDGPGEAVLFATTQSIIACPVAQEVRARENVGLTTYRYQYTGNFTNISPLPWMGAYHSSELPLLFDTHFLYRGNSTPYEYEVANTMQALWLSFANDPQKAPSTGEITWPVYDSEQDSMLLFAEGDVKTQFVSGERIDGNCTL
ncbi:chlorogenic acid esterase precursor [Botrytis cinerea]